MIQGYGANGYGKVCVWLGKLNIGQIKLRVILYMDRVIPAF